MIYIHKDKIINNFKKLEKIFKTTPAVVLKSDAYGLGIENILPILLLTKCKKFFVRNLEEGIKIRQFSDDFEIIILDPILEENISLYKKFKLIPSINREFDLQFFSLLLEIPVALQVDIGMNRFGLKNSFIKENLEKIKKLQIVTLYAHLCLTKEIPINKINFYQESLFEEIVKLFPNIEASLLSSNCVFFPEKFFYSYPRIGKALYGIHPNCDDFELAIDIIIKIIDVKKIKKGESIGYNNYQVLEDTTIGVLSIGYGDGLPIEKDLKVYYNNQEFPVVSISMEYAIVDFFQVNIKIGDTIKLFPNNFFKETVKLDKIYNNYYLNALLKLKSLKKIVI